MLRVNLAHRAPICHMWTLDYDVHSARLSLVAYFDDSTSFIFLSSIHVPCHAKLMPEIIGLYLP
jgi:hypothetical protein